MSLFEICGRTVVSALLLAGVACSSDPKAVKAKRVASAERYLGSGRVNEAIVEYRAALHADQNDGQLRLRLAELYERKGDAGTAEFEYVRAAEALPNRVDLQVRAGNIHLSSGRFDDAKLSAERAVAASPGNIEAMLLAARTSAALGDDAAAEQWFRRALLKAPKSLAAYAGLGQLYSRQGRLDEALREFEAMAALEEQPVISLTLAGTILQSQGKILQAQARFERALRADPSAPVAANNLAWILLETGGNLDVALGLAQTAKRGLPHSAEVDDTLGMIYFKKNLFSMAIPAFKASVARVPSAAAYHHHLGLAYAKTGALAPARQALSRALSIDANFDDAAEARKLLESLEGPH